MLSPLALGWCSSYLLLREIAQNWWCFSFKATPSLFKKTYHQHSSLNTCFSNISQKSLKMCQKTKGIFKCEHRIAILQIYFVLHGFLWNLSIFVYFAQFFLARLIESFNLVVSTFFAHSWAASNYFLVAEMRFVF